jgi:Tfp pilus assembly protein PilF
MASTTTPFTLLDDMFSTLASQESQKAAAANSALGSGLSFYQKKDFERASSEFKRAIAMDPTNPQSYNYLANSFLAQKKPEEAVKVYKSSLSLDPSQDSVHVSLANIYLQSKKYNLAEKEFKAASKLNPSSTLAPYMLGQMYQQTGRYAEAEKQFKQVIHMAPGDANPLYALGATYNKEGKYADAVKVLAQAVKLRPKMAAAHLELGSAYAALDDTVNAQKEVDTLTRLDATQGALLQAVVAKPKMVSAGGGITDNFTSSLGMNTPVWALDISLIKPNASKEFSMTFSFDSKMDTSSVQDASNWTITKASGGAAGYYNNTLPIVPTEAYIPQNPTRISYDPDQQTATVTFLLSQNADGNATIDPSHMVFKFSGKDIKGKTMDPSADQFDGAAQVPI